MWLLIGIPIGILSAVKRGTFVERLAMSVALIAISAPVYWLGLVSIYLFSKDIGAVPDLRRHRHLRRPLGQPEPVVRAR